MQSLTDQSPLDFDSEIGYSTNYFQKIEAFFATLRGRGLMLSPTDYQLAKTWFDQGIPLSCVLRGISTACLKFITKSNNPEDEIRSLAYCRWAVKQEYNEYRSVAAETERTESPAEHSKDEILNILDSLLFDLRRALGAIYKSGTSDLGHKLITTCEQVQLLIIDSKRRHLDCHSIEDTLRRLDEWMINAVIDNAPDELRTPAEAAVILKLGSHRRTMTAEAYESTLKAALSSHLRRKLNLPQLTLYGI